MESILAFFSYLNFFSVFIINGSRKHVLTYMLQNEFIVSVKGGLSPSKKVAFICFNDEKCLFHVKRYPFSKYLNFCSVFFDHVGKRLDKNVKVNFKFYDVTDWTINNYNTHIVQCLTK